MGLLDDAIREHLELKRRRGADPGEIALQERAALAPVLDDRGRAPEHPLGEPAEHPEAVAAEPAGTAGPAAEEPAWLEPAQDAPAAQMEVPAAAAGPAPAAAPHGDALVPAHGTATQETAEIDMRAVLAEEAHEPPHGDALAAHAEEQGEWDWAERGEGPPQEIPGQERLSFE